MVLNIIIFFHANVKMQIKLPVFGLGRKHKIIFSFPDFPDVFEYKCKNEYF